MSSESDNPNAHTPFVVPNTGSIRLANSIRLAKSTRVGDNKDKTEIPPPLYGAIDTLEEEPDDHDDDDDDDVKEASNDFFDLKKHESLEYGEGEPEFVSPIKQKIVDFLLSDAQYDSNDVPIFDPSIYSSVPALIRHFLWNPVHPEFTSLQQFNWAIFLGILMGFFTAVWQWWIEFGFKFFWEKFPVYLYNWGVFTDADGNFPLYHYMWLLPCILGSLLSYIYAVLPVKIPTQDEWIKGVHSKGIEDPRTFFPLFFLSTAAMWSGLSLGPELPLVVTGGMAGSWLGLVTEQSILQARVLNLTSASAAVSAFFGFPMAGALFVLELPHRMGLQYFEALSPATIASIVGVLANRLITGNEITGYFKYPFLEETLPSSIFMDAIVYGFYGCAIGIFYVKVVKFFKVWVHDLFHDHDHGHETPTSGEHKPLLSSDHEKVEETVGSKVRGAIHKFTSCGIRYEPHRAAVAGAIVGVLVGIFGIFVPHTMFWGEAQLQNLIDRGLTPLPVFGDSEGGPLSAFTKFSYCLIDSDDDVAIKKGFGIECSLLILISKSITIGLSLGTGIIAGQFWGPLFVGCAAAHLLTDVCTWLSNQIGFGGALVAHPCVVILCTMASAHVVTFRSHMGIMLILTLTISAFKPGDDPFSQYMAGGDYSAVFPLLVVSVFISLMAARDTIFYVAQTSRGDITAVPEVLCQPNKVGAPVVLRYAGGESDDDDFTTASGSGGDIAESGEVTKTEEKAIQEAAALLKGESPTASTTASHHSYHKQSSSSSFQQRDKMVHHETFGDLEGHQQPSLTDQALLHASSSVSHSHHRSSSTVGTSSAIADSSGSSGGFIFSLFRKSSRNIDQE